jgi:hypothetical protein
MNEVNVKSASSITSEQIWAEFYKQIADIAVPGLDKSKQVISMVGTTLNADVVNADPEVSNGNIYNIGNCLPANSPSYAPAGDLITSYSLFLDNIDLGGDPNPALKAKINAAAQSVTENQNNFTKVQQDAYKQFVTYKTDINPEYKGSFDEWANANYPVYPAAKSSLNGAIADYDTLMVQAHGAGYTTIQAAKAAVSPITGARNITQSNAYNMPVKVGSIVPEGSQKALPGQEVTPPKDKLKSTYRPAFGIGGGLAKEFSAWQTASVNNKFGVSIQLTGNKANAKYSDFGWSEKVKASYRSWFSVKVDQKASYSAVGEDWDKSSFDCEISFNGLKSFPINADANWFESGLIQNFKEKLLPTSPQFFGENGSLSLIPSSVILGYGLKVKIVLENEQYHSLKTAFQQSAEISVGVGCFNFSGSESSHNYKSKFSYDDNSNTIIIEPTPSDIPFLMGVVSNKY